MVHGLAAAELSLGRPEEAVRAARAASSLDPANASMHHLLAQALAGVGDWEEAVLARRASLEWGFSDRPASWLLLGQELLNTGDTTAAGAAVDSAAVLPMDANEQAVMARLRAAIDGGAAR